MDWAVGVDLSTIPPSSLRRAGMILLDDVAAMVAPQEEKELLRILEWAIAGAGTGESTILLNGRQASRQMAAMINAAACGWCQLDEGYRKASCHAGLYVLPALLAEAEARDLSLNEVLRALVVAYEIVTRVASTWTCSASPHHSHAQYSAVGAASAVGLARRLSAQTLLDAVSGASTISPVGPLIQMVEGALISNLYPGIGAWSGMNAVDWAEIGITGLGSSLHDVFGTARGGTFNPGGLCSDLGRVWAVDFGYHKRYASCQRIHAGADAVMDLIRDLPDHDRGRKIRRMVVTTHDAQLDGRSPQNSLATRFSFPHALAAMVVLGHGDASAFGSATLEDPDIAALRGKVEVVPYVPPRPWPLDRAVRVAITLDDGRIFERECTIARGSPDEPLTDAEIIAKARALADPVYPMLVPVLREIMDVPEARNELTWRIVLARIASRGACPVGSGDDRRTQCTAAKLVNASSARIG